MTLKWPWRLTGLNTHHSMGTQSKFKLCLPFSLGTCLTPSIASLWNIEIPHVLIKYLPFFWDFADCCGIIESGETTLFYANSFYSSSSFIIIRILTAIIIITIPIIDRLSRSPSGQMLWWFVSSVNLSGKQLKCSRAVEGKLWKCFRLLLFWFRFKTEKARQR